MQKLTVFTLLLSVVVITAVVEIATQDYFTDDPSFAREIAFGEKAAAPEDGDMEIAEPVDLVTNITDDVLTKAGFQQYQLRQHMRVPTALFGFIDLTEELPPVIQKFVVAEASETSGTIYEMFEADNEAAEELYFLLRKKTMEVSAYTVNETNSFGEKSFYINDNQGSDTVRVIAQIGSDLYAITYERGEHFKFSNLLKLLSGE